jgi:hypothetical protein
LKYESNNEQEENGAKRAERSQGCIRGAKAAHHSYKASARNQTRKTNPVLSSTSRLGKSIASAQPKKLIARRCHECHVATKAGNRVQKTNVGHRNKKNMAQNN